MRREEFRLNEFSFSSSLLPMTERHKEVFPQTQKVTRIQVQCRRLDSIRDLKIEQPALMKIDVQGAELEVLDGAAEMLKKFAAVQLEVNFEPFYAGQPNYVEVMSHMYDHGFRRFIQREAIFTGQYGLTHSDLLFF